MKVIRILSFVLGIIALILCGWSILELGSDSSNKVEAGLNFVYFISLFVAFFCLRISLANKRRVHPVVLILSLLIVVFSSYVWFDAPKLLSLGKINLGLIALLVGITLMLMTKSDSKLSKPAQIIVGTTSLLIASSAFLQIESPFFYTISFIGLATSSVLTIIALVLKKA